jgi:hypothetical protein
MNPYLLKVSNETTSFFTLYLFTMDYKLANKKRIETNLSKYNVDNVSKLPEVQQKRRITFENKRRTLFFYQEPRIHKLDSSNLKIYRLSKSYSDKWLETYHPFGSPKGNVLSLGLVDDNNCYCIMTFKKSRDKNYSSELSRMWMLPTYQIVSGYDILSSEASKFGVSSIISYVNMSFENYKDYESIGMKYVRDIQRTKWWIKDDIKISDSSRRQYKLKQEDMLDNGYLPVYDCGQRVYVFDL